MNYIYDPTSNEKVYNLRQLSEALNLEGIGPNILSSYLKKLGIIHPNNIADIRYLYLGYFKIAYGSRNHNSSKKYAKPLTTESGVEWLKNNMIKHILKEDEEYIKQDLENKKKKKLVNAK